MAPDVLGSRPTAETPDSSFSAKRHHAPATYRHAKAAFVPSSSVTMTLSSRDDRDRPLPRRGSLDPLARNPNPLGLLPQSEPRICGDVTAKRALDSTVCKAIPTRSTRSLRAFARELSDLRCKNGCPTEPAGATRQADVRPPDTVLGRAGRETALTSWPRSRGQRYPAIIRPSRNARASLSPRRTASESLHAHVRRASATAATSLDGQADHLKILGPHCRESRPYRSSPRSP